MCVSYDLGVQLGGQFWMEQFDIFQLLAHLVGMSWTPSQYKDGLSRYEISSILTTGLM